MGRKREKRRGAARVARPDRTTWRAGGLAVLLLCCVLGAWVRIETTLSLESFDAARPERMLQSDPALLYYFADRIVESGGLPPDDFRADPRLEHPETSDLPAMFTVGQEFLVAWSHLLFGGNTGLHVTAVVVMGIVASLTAVGVYGLTRELAGSHAWAAFAAALFALTPANYRTLGFILVREDLSLPLFALHLWLLARAARLRTAPAFALAGLIGVASVATWHAMLFVVAVEAAVVFAWFLRTGENPLAVPRAWWFAVAVVGGSLLVPVLRAKLFLVSPPVLLLGGLGLAALFERRRLGDSRVQRLASVGAVLLGLGAVTGAQRLWPGRFGDYGHVLELLWAKLRYLGELPNDPAVLGFGARLLWQGPFETGWISAPLSLLAVAGVLLPVAVLRALPGWWKGSGDAGRLLVLGFALACLPLAVGVFRLVILAGIVAPVAIVFLLRDVRAGTTAAWVVGLLAVQGYLLSSHVRDYDTKLDIWYQPVRQQEMGAALRWMRDELPPDGAIAADFASSSAILAHTRHAVVLQPKYETSRSRERIERFVSGLYTTPPAQFHHLLRHDFRADYLLVDAGVLWGQRYQGGLRRDAEAPVPGTAAAAFVTAEPPRQPIPGFRLLYKSSDEPTAWRLFEVLPWPEG